MKNKTLNVSDIDYEELISRADLTYSEQVPSSDDGLPVGNGRMGSLVWTTPKAIKFQINRVDVFANNCETDSFNKRDEDYGYGCCFLDIAFASFDENIFPPVNTKQHLSVYNGLVTIKGAGVTTEIFTWPEDDVIAVRVNDERYTPEPVTVKLRMLRAPEVITKHHTAESFLKNQDEKIGLIQKFEEGNHYCGSATVAAMPEKEASAHITNEREICLTAKPETGSFTIFIGTDSSFEKNEDLFETAAEKVSKAVAIGHGSLLSENKKWWHKYWKRSFVHLHSEDNDADNVEKNYTYFLYLMAASSRGAYPPNYGGMIFSTKGDKRQWGAQQWWTNLSIYYRGLFPTNRLELFEPLFRQYSGMYESCRRAARQQWGSKGVYFPETTFFDGLAELPNDIAEEMKDLYLLSKPWECRSKRFREYAFSKHPHSSRWNWKLHGRFTNGRWTYNSDKGPFSAVVHFFKNTLEIGYLYWKRYEYSLDKEWLRREAYPVIKGAVEFLRNFPNMKKSLDGKYHLYHVNCGEAVRGTRDPIGTLAGLYGLLPVLIKASEILDLDAEIRPDWEEFYENLPPLPTSHHPDANDDWSGKTPGVDQPPIFVTGLKPTLQQTPSGYNPFNFGIRYYDFDLATLESQHNNPEDFEKWKNTFKFRYPDGITDQTEIDPMSSIGTIAARLGDARNVKNALLRLLESNPGKFIVKKEEDKRILKNRLTLREGYNAIGAQRLGNLTYTLHEALCQSVPPAPGKDAVIRVFPAWPENWNAEFRLLCRGGFLVTSAIEKGEILFVAIHSQNGGTCRLRNPWGRKKVDIYGNEKKQKESNDNILEIDTSPGDDMLVMEAGKTPD